MAVVTRFVLLVLFLCVVMARANATPIFYFGMSLEYTVVPGTDVEVLGALRNAGDAPVVFPVEFSSGSPSEQGGSVPASGITRGNTEEDWEVIDLWSFGRIEDFGRFLPQFEGVVVAPGATFTFVLGHFIAPFLGDGTPSRSTFDFALDLTDDIRAATAIAGDNLPNFDNSPDVTFTLGQSSSVSAMVFNQLCVADQARGTVVSGPTGCIALQVPEPPGLALLALGLCGLVVARRRAAGIAGCGPFCRARTFSVGHGRRHVGALYSNAHTAPSAIRKALKDRVIEG
jgi:PEP-CTERM motif